LIGFGKITELLTNTIVCSFSYYTLREVSAFRLMFWQYSRVSA